MFSSADTRLIANMVDSVGILIWDSSKKEGYP